MESKKYKNARNTVHSNALFDAQDSSSLIITSAAHAGVALFVFATCFYFAEKDNPKVSSLRSSSRIRQTMDAKSACESVGRRPVFLFNSIINVLYSKFVRSQLRVMCE
jgi:hypothetical protein